ncbi:MAG: PSD1 and planctomycete cytochrome C domain-containing protein [Opitutales bacterium]
MVSHAGLNNSVVFFTLCSFYSSLLATPVDFTNEVRPILSEYCFHCHGPDKSTRKAKLRLDLSEGALADLGGYSAVIPGKPEDSELMFRLHSEDEDELMPPPENGKSLTNEQKKILEDWIREGARYQEHWSFLPIDDPQVPEKNAKTQSDHPIDRFLARKLLNEPFSFAEQSDPVTLLRRLYFDLVGMPPTPEEAKNFLSDSSSEAYDKLIDRLLIDPRFGERMAVHWLDLVRYSDTIGYHSDNFMEVSAYRDYVIEAFNENLPYDQFVIENLAGDLIPEATQKQKIASGYNRLLQTTQEGGAQAAEYKAIYQADRVRNFGIVWLGATTGCAQCHDHKYDPFTIKDFYSLAAFFADLKEKPVGRRNPNLYLPTQEQSDKLEDLEKTKHALEQEAKKTKKRLEKENKNLLNRLEKALTGFSYAEPKNKEPQVSERIWVEDSAPADAKLSGKWELASHPVFSGSKSIVRTGKGNNQHFFIQSKSPHTVLSGEDEFFAYVYLDPENPPRQIMLQFNDGAWDHRAYWGESLIPFGQENTVSRVKMGPLPELGKWVRLSIPAQKIGLNPKVQVNGIAFTQWDGTIYWDQIGVIAKIDPRKDPHLSLQAWTAQAKGDQSLAVKIQKTVQKKAEDRSLEESKLLETHFIHYHYRGIPQKALAFRKKIQAQKTEIAQKTAEVEKSKKEIENHRKTIRSMLVSESGNSATVRILPRGNWLDETGEVVHPAIPEFLGKLQTGERQANRMDLAKWVASPDNPLPARAFVNRVWKLFFGYGLSRRMEDLGGQGEPPTHADLLDHLATDFRTNQWNIKKLIRTLITSDAYRQSSTPSDKLASADPLNRLYARQSRFRIDAEFVRDSALSISGLLVSKMGGTSVKPYQPAGYWQHLNFPARKWQAGKGEDLYRRGLYTFHCRSFTHPAMLAFDAPSREECSAERPRSNIPQQALVLLNDPVFVEAARSFADNLLSLRFDTDSQRIDKSFQWALTRKPTSQEKKVLIDLLAEQRARYQTDEASALALVQTGEKPVNPDLSVSELAAWTSLTRALLNLYETTARF